jgi:hypothetical protein
VKGMEPQFLSSKEWWQKQVNEFQENMDKKLRKAQKQLNELKGDTKKSEWNQGRQKKQKMK